MLHGMVLLVAVSGYPRGGIGVRADMHAPRGSAADLAAYPLLPDPLPLPLSLAQRQQAISHEGGLARLRCLLDKLDAGGNVTMAVLGGSVSAGSSSRVRPDQTGLYHRKIHRWLQQRWPRANIRHINAAMPAVPPGYMEQCLSLHVPDTVDLVLLEAAANLCGHAPRSSRGRARRRGAASGDDGEESDAAAAAANDPCAAGRESVERMLRQVLRFGGAPAVVMVHAFPFWTMQTPKSWYQSYARRPNGVRRTVASVPLSHSEDLAFTFHRQWGHEANEDMLEQLARFYDLPSISLRNVLWHHMKANTTFNGLRLPQLYYDRIHPSDYGHTILAHGLAHLVKRTQAVLSAAALEEAQAVLGVSGDAGAVAAAAGGALAAAAAPLCMHASPSRTLPPPMQPNVAGAASRRLECHDADSLHALVDRTEGCPGWAYTLERSSSGVPKPGWIATSAGARCTFAYTLSPGSSATHRIGIGYLKSYERMGRVQVQCVHQCACGDGIVIDAHHRERISPLDLIYVSAHLTSPAATPPSGAGATATNTRTAAAIYLGAGAMPARCGLRLTVLNASSSGDHKFKLTALFMNQHGDASYFGRWIFNQAAEARGAVEVAEMVEAKSQKSKLRRATMGDRGKARRGRRWRAPASAVQHAGTARAF